MKRLPSSSAVAAPRPSRASSPRRQDRRSRRRSRQHPSSSRRAASRSAPGLSSSPSRPQRRATRWRRSRGCRHSGESCSSSRPDSRASSRRWHSAAAHGGGARQGRRRPGQRGPHERAAIRAHRHSILAWVDMKTPGLGRYPSAGRILDLRVTHAFWQEPESWWCSAASLCAPGWVTHPDRAVCPVASPWESSRLQRRDVRGRILLLQLDVKRCDGFR